MISLKCKNCGGEMSVDLKGELFCPYCGSTAFFSDTDLTEYREFRSNLLNYLRICADREADRAEESALWNYHDTAVFTSSDGKRITVDHIFRSAEDNVECYTARESVIFVFPAEKKHLYPAMTQGLSRLEYPSAALRNLSRCFPSVKSVITLDNGGVLVAVAKPENAFPLSAFGNIMPEHAAWIVSRLENICCVFEYSELCHNGISIDSVFINTRTHEAFLYGGWWNSRPKRDPSDNNDLLAIRSVAGRIMGTYKDQAPELFDHFIKSSPAEDAYTDFQKWDNVIEKGFGGHRFVKFRQ